MIDPSRYRFEDPGHRYYLDGRKVPSITQALKVATYDDFDFVQESVLDRKRIQGQDFHALVEEYHETGDIDLGRADPDLLPDFDAFADFIATSGWKIARCETIVASAKWRFAGRLDLVLKRPAELMMVDIKRTYNIPPSVGPQTAAQEIAFTETFDTKIDGRGCLHIKDGRANFVHCKDATDRNIFLAALTVTHWRESHGKDRY